MNVVFDLYIFDALNNSTSRGILFFPLFSGFGKEISLPSLSFFRFYNQRLLYIFHRIL